MIQISLKYSYLLIIKKNNNIGRKRMMRIVCHPHLHLQGEEKRVDEGNGLSNKF